MNHHHFIDVLEAHAARRADHTAVQFLADGREVSATASFAALHARAVSLAALLQQRYAPEARILLMLPSGMEYVDTFCACQYAGMIAVPLFAPQSRRPRHLDRVRNIVADARPALILSTEAAQPVLRELAASLGIDVDILTVAQLDAAAAAPVWRRPVSDPDAVAFLQYTSGSTGAPKGVVVRQRNLLANLELMRTALGFAPDDCAVNWLPLYHDMGLIGGLLLPIYVGMRCVLMETKSFVQSPSVWLQAISRYRGTASFAPNSAYALCVSGIDDGTIAQLDLSCWKHAISGAEPVHAATLAAFGARFAGAGFRRQSLSPGYGQAEATLCVCTVAASELPLTLRLDKAALQNGRAVLAPDSGDAAEFVSCGHPQALHRIAIVNPDTLSHCPSGEIGEIWLHGPSNADAYWGQPEISEQTFRARAVGDDAHYLRSGDLGFMHEGQLVVCGRLKDLIILNGRNLYPNDIEFAVTQAESGIRAGRIAAFSVPDPHGAREQLVIVAEPHRRYADGAARELLFAAVRDAISEAADCAVDVIVLIAAATIPMTTSGKISRSGARREYLDNTLQVIAATGGQAAGTALPQALPDLATLRAQGATREAMAAACAAWLNLQVAALRPGAAPDPQSTLIGLGFDSIAIATLHGRLRMHTGWHAPFETMFGAGSLDMLAQGLQRHLELQQASSDAIPALPGSTEKRQSHAQRRLWFLNRLDPRSCEHNIAVRLSLRGPLDADALQRSLHDLTERHSVLRTAYRDSTQGPLQLAMPGAPAPLHCIDLSALPALEQQEKLARMVRQERDTPFDLTAGVMLRATLASCAPDQHELLIGLHHIAFDGRSAEIFLADLDRLYAAHSTGSASAFGPHPLDYADFAEWEHARLTAPLVAAELQFWRGYLNDMPHTLALPVQNGATPGKGLHTFKLASLAVARLEQYCRSHNSTVFMGLLTLFGACLHYWSGQQRFIIGTDVAGRAHPQLDDIIGFFVNQLPLRCDLDGNPSLAELFSRVAADAQAAYAHQELPFNLLVSAIAPERSGKESPLFQVKLNWQPERAHATSLGALRIADIAQYQDGGAFDLVLDLTHGANGVTANLKYQAARFDQHAIDRFVQLWTGLIDGFDALLPLPLSLLTQQMRERDNALRLALQQRQTSDSRALLGAARRRVAQA
ncbi:condensation domain-containing protein [Massilia scottii]|uniref:condensation domain-containing protein n=1 Tax=Massilia scottii TaxID=3057166 RepID=UPI0027967A3A|nr:condensation domain-containing protein [Massilia sp. CCM 9029]MDQ1831839.1 condensation domain-containing protein [Massilia sp. CCM 9029]